MLQDLRYAVRTLFRTPAFTAVALLTIAIGTGANTTVFGFVNALLFRPAPGVADPRTLVAVYTSDFSSGPYGSSSYPDLVSIRHDAPAFAALAAQQGNRPVALRTAETAERVRLQAVSGNYFSLLGVRAETGRLIGESDTRPSAPPIAVIADDLWRRTFNADPAAIGSVVMLDGRPHTITGVASHAFTGLDLARGVDVWTPIVPPAGDPAERGNRGYSIIGRLHKDVTLETAQAQLDTIAARLAAEFPSTNRGTLRAPDAPRAMIVLPHTRLAPQFRADVAMLGAVIMGAVALVLLIACANVANLLLSRATTRGREMAIRLALGASRRRILRQLITESLLLGAAGGALGVLFSLWTADILPSFFPPEQARMVAARFDMPAVMFATAVSIAASLLFGLAPALHASRASAPTLRGDAGRVSDSPAGTRLRRLVVASQVALAVVLLVSSTLLVRSLTNALNADLGFATRDAVLASVDLPSAEFSAAQGQAYYDTALGRLAAIPGIRSAALGTYMPLSGRARRGFRLDGYEPRAGEDMELNINTISAGYFDTLQMPLVAGRSFDARDTATSTPVVVVNDVLARRYFNGDALARRITDSRGNAMEVVGVVRAGRHRSVQEEPVPVVFYPVSQNYSPGMTFIARTATAPDALIAAVRQELTAVDRRVPVFRTITLASHLGEATTGDRLTASLVSACGALALLLAVVGIYGVTAYAVIRRTREIGVRIALGASRAHVLRLVLAEGLTVSTLGIVAGLVLSAIASRALSSMLFGVSAWDAGAYLMTPAVLALVSLVAALGPARRALRVQPIAVLRQE